MSVTKDQIDLIQDYRSIACEILLEIGAIRECELHSDFYYDTKKLDESSIYAMSANKLKEKYGEEQNFKIFSSQIDEIMKSASPTSACPFCSNL